jgi:hypothetical protein
LTALLPQAFFSSIPATVLYAASFIEKKGIFIFKLGSITSITLYKVFMKKNRWGTLLSSLIFFNSTVIFIFYYKNTPYYAIPWITLFVYSLARKNSSITSFEKAILTTWCGHAVGTISYGAMTGFLSTKAYIALLPIACMERFVMSLALYLYIKYNYMFSAEKIFPKIWFIIKKVLNTKLVKTYLLEKIKNG